MKKLSILFLLVSVITSAQIGINTTSPHNSAVLEVLSTDKGFLPPRMTTAERNVITNPVEGLLIYNTERKKIQFFRENVGPSNNLSGWYDSGCVSDTTDPFAGFPTGISLDFSNPGIFFPDLGGGGTAFTASTPTDTNVGSIGPFTDLNGNSGLYLDFFDRAENGNLTGQSGGHKFKFINTELPNTYNASTFLKRNPKTSGKGDLFTKTFSSSYNGSFDLILVAKFNSIPTKDNASIFSTGEVLPDKAFQIGNNKSSSSCGRKRFTLLFADQKMCGLVNSKDVFIDTNFHRFRVKYTDDTTSADAIVEFYIDGVMVESYQGMDINATVLARLDLFNNRGRTSFANASIAYLGLFSGTISPAQFEQLDAYLACKFESQP